MAMLHGEGVLFRLDFSRLVYVVVVKVSMNLQPCRTIFFQYLPPNLTKTAIYKVVVAMLHGEEALLGLVFSRLVYVGVVKVSINLQYCQTIFFVYLPPI